GTPRITLNTAPNAVVDYSSGSGTSSLTFNYTVQAGDTQASALDYLNTGALALNGGTIKDVALNNATLTLPAVNGGSSMQNSWTANPAANPSAYSVTGTDIAGNSASTSIAFVSDTTAPASGALTIGGFSNSLTVSPNVTALYAETASATAAGLKATGGNALTR